jgi:hypothetical protein
MGGQTAGGPFQTALCTKMSRAVGIGDIHRYLRGQSVTTAHADASQL